MGELNLGSILKRLQIDQSTGSLVCVGDDNNFARVYLVDGEPKAARCRNLQGREALRKLSGAPLASVKFHDGVNLIKSDAEDEGIADFVLDDDESAAAGVDSGSSAAIEALIDDDGGSWIGKKLSAAEREILAAELVEYVGPVAQMVVGGLDEEIGLAEALKLLALEIGDPQIAAEFIDRVRQKI